jgi:hypothetical protein
MATLILTRLSSAHCAENRRLGSERQDQEKTFFHKRKHLPKKNNSAIEEERFGAACP